jgi:hypothetical protein
MVTEMSIDKESKEARQAFDRESGAEQKLPTATMPAASQDQSVEVTSSPVPPDILPPFDKTMVATPKVMVHKKPNPYPIAFTGHLPQLAPLDSEETERLSEFKTRDDADAYVLKKNQHADKDKFYLKVLDAQTLKPGAFVNNKVINFQT